MDGYVQNHPFIHGNKRVGLEAALVFFKINDLSLDVTVNEANGTVASVENRNRRLLSWSFVSILNNP